MDERPPPEWPRQGLAPASGCRLSCYAYSMRGKIQMPDRLYHDGNAQTARLLHMSVAMLFLKKFCCLWEQE